jgi:hypothetical protein
VACEPQPKGTESHYNTSVPLTLRRNTAVTATNQHPCSGHYEKYTIPPYTVSCERVRWSAILGQRCSTQHTTSTVQLSTSTGKLNAPLILYNPLPVFSSTSRLDLELNGERSHSRIYSTTPAANTSVALKQCPMQQIVDADSGRELIENAAVHTEIETSTYTAIRTIDPIAQRQHTHPCSNCPVRLIDALQGALSHCVIQPLQPPRCGTLTHFAAVHNQAAHTTHIA